MIKIYIAGPLFSEAERQFNITLNQFVKDLGYQTFLPQHDGHELSKYVSNEKEKIEIMEEIFKLDINEVNNCDILIFIMDGRVPDEGACVELGYAFSLGKECIGLKTDCRSLMDNLDNPMIIGALNNRIANDFNELAKYLYEINSAELINDTQKEESDSTICLVK